MALTQDLKGLPAELRDWRGDVGESLEDTVSRNRRLDSMLDLKTVLSAVAVTLAFAVVLKLLAVSALIGTVIALVVLAIALVVVAEMRREPGPREPVAGHD
jgi:hypothetical protein